MDMGDLAGAIARWLLKHPKEMFWLVVSVALLGVLLDKLGLMA